MKRLGLILAAFWLFSDVVGRAGELDAEFAGKSRAVAASSALTNPSSELDSESPTQACCLKRRFYSCTYFGPYGYGYSFGYGRGCRGFGCGGFGYGGFGGYGGYGGGFGYGGGLGYGGYGGLVGYGGGFY
jgi:hypothetical protein